MFKSDITVHECEEAACSFSFYHFRTCLDIKGQKKKVPTSRKEICCFPRGMWPSLRPESTKQWQQNMDEQNCFCPAVEGQKATGVKGLKTYSTHKLDFQSSQQASALICYTWLWKMSLSFLSADEAVKQLIMSGSSTVNMCEMHQRSLPAGLLLIFGGLLQHKYFILWHFLSREIEFGL